MSENATKKARAMGINHVVLEVGDLDQALEFYGAIFDFTLRGRSDHNAFVDLGDQFIQLSLGKTQEADGKRHFGFVVDDRTPVRAALERLGVKTLDQRLNFPRPLGQPHRGGALRRRPVLQGAKRAQRHGTRGGR